MAAKPENIRNWAIGTHTFIAICAECAEPVGSGYKCGCEEKDILIAA